MTKRIYVGNMSFETTEDSSYYQPYELATGDLNGDGRQDLVLIAHDRILIYLQEE